MKVNAAQQELIGQILRSLLKYKDTYDEVYDHIVTSLEFVPNDVNFVNELHYIIETELGGAKGIKRIETKYRNIAIRNFIKDYFSNIAKCFTSAITPVILICTVGFYLLVKDDAYNDHKIELAVCQIPVLTQLLLMVIKTISGKTNVKITANHMVDAKTWILSINVGWLGMVVLVFDVWIKAIYSGLALKGLPGIDFGPYPLTLLFLISVLHSLTYYNLFKDMPTRSLSDQ